jgi:hypothetical protein
MEEEGARRRKYNGRGGAGPRGFLGGLNEDDEDDDGDEEQQMLSAAGVGTGLHDTGRGGQRARQPVAASAKRTQRTGFELDLDGATLLERRHQRRRAPVGTVVVSSPLSGKTVSSPLRMEGLTVEEDSEEAGIHGVHVSRMAPSIP